MPGIAGRRALVYVTGLATTLTAEATTNLGDDQSYQITNAAKRLLDPFAAISVLIGGTLAAEPYTLNRLTGTVEFASANGARPAVTVTGSYLPKSIAVGAKGYSWNVQATTADDTDFDSANTDNGFMRRVAAGLDVTGSITAKWRGDTYFRDALVNGSLFVIEFFPDRSLARDLACWAELSKRDLSVALEETIEMTVEFQGTADADGRAASQ